MQAGQWLKYKAVPLRRPGLLLPQGFVQSAGRIRCFHFPPLNEGMVHKHLLNDQGLCLQIPASLERAIGQLGRKLILNVVFQAA